MKRIFIYIFMMMFLALTACGTITKYHDERTFTSYDNGMADFHVMENKFPVFRGTMHDIYNVSPLVKGKNPGGRVICSFVSIPFDMAIDSVLFVPELLSFFIIDEDDYLRD